MDKVKAKDIYSGVNGVGCAYFVGSIASIVELAVLGGRTNINIDKLLQAFDNAREYTQKKSNIARREG